jgi:hypothetical protein
MCIDWCTMIAGAERLRSGKSAVWRERPLSASSGTRREERACRPNLLGEVESDPSGAARAVPRTPPGARHFVSLDFHPM